MLTDILSNKFGINLEDVTNFTDNTRGVPAPVFFKYICKCYTNDGNDDKIFDDASYVSLDAHPQMDDFFDTVIKYMSNDMYINRYPKSQKASIDRFVTKVSIKVSSLSAAVTFFANAITAANLQNTLHAKKYILALHRILSELDKYCLNFNADPIKKNCRLFVDMYDSVVNSSQVSFFNTVTNSPVFSANSIESTTKIKDYQLNFSDKVEGVVSASFNVNPFILHLTKTLLCYDTIDGASMNVSNDKITIDYIGSIVDPYFIHNYKQYKSLLKLTFVPVNKKIFSNKVEFDKFNDMINYVNDGVFGRVENRLIKIPLKLHSIEITSNNNKENNPYLEELSIFNIFKNFLLSLYPDKNMIKKDSEIDKIVNSETIPAELTYDKINNKLSYVSEDSLPTYEMGVNFYYE